MNWFVFKNFKFAYTQQRSSQSGVTNEPSLMTEDKLKFSCTQDTQVNQVHFPAASWCFSVPVTVEHLTGKAINRKMKHLPTTKFGRGPTNPIYLSVGQGRNKKFPIDFQELSPKILGVEGCKGNQFLSAFPHYHRMTSHIHQPLHQTEIPPSQL